MKTQSNLPPTIQAQASAAPQKAQIQRQTTDLKTSTVPSWLSAFQDFHNQQIANYLKKDDNTSRLAHFLRGQFYEYGLFGYEKSPDKALTSYKKGSLLSDPLSCYRIAEACSHQDNILKVPPNFEENVFYQAMTIAFMHLYYGTQIFDCQNWFENYRGIDPELTTLCLLLNRKIMERASYSNQFSSPYQIQDLIINLINMRSQTTQTDLTKSMVQEEKVKIQTAYDDTVNQLIQFIHKRSQDITKNSSFAYEVLLYLFTSESSNSSKKIGLCYETLTKYPVYLLHALKSLNQEMEIMLLLPRDNPFFSHMRFVLIEIHNLNKAILSNCDDRNQPTLEILQIQQLLEVTFKQILDKRNTILVQSEGDLIFTLRHQSEVIAERGTREALESAIEIQSQELSASKDQKNQPEEIFAYCYYKLGSYRRRLINKRTIHQADKNNTVYKIDGRVQTSDEYYKIQENRMKQNFDKAEQLYENKIKNINEQPFSKYLATFYIGRITQKYKHTENISYRYYYKVTQTYDQQFYLFDNSRTLQFQLIHQKALKRLQKLQSTDPNLSALNYQSLSQSAVQPNNGSVKRAGTDLKGEENTNLRGSTSSFSPQKRPSAINNALENSIYQSANMTAPAPLKEGIQNTFNDGNLNNSFHKSSSNVYNNQNGLIQTKTLQSNYPPFPTQLNGSSNGSILKNNGVSGNNFGFNEKQATNQSINSSNNYNNTANNDKNKNQINNNLSQSSTKQFDQQGERNNQSLSNSKVQNSYINSTQIVGSAQFGQTDQQYQQQQQLQRFSVNNNNQKQVSWEQNQDYNSFNVTGTQLYKSFINSQELQQLAAREIKLKELIRKCSFGQIQSILYKEERYTARKIELVPTSFFTALQNELKEAKFLTEESLLQVLAVSKWHPIKDKKGPNDPLSILLISDEKQHTLDQLIKQNLILSPSIAYRIAVQIARGVSALHDAGLVHTNLTLENVVVDSSFNAFISNWTIERLLVFQVDRAVDEWAVSLAFAAPEIIEPGNGNGRGSVNMTSAYGDDSSRRTQRASLFSSDSDVWSLGVILLCLFFDFFPSQKNVQDIHLYTGITLNNFNPKLNKMQSLIVSMLKPSPLERIGTTEVLQKLLEMESFFKQEA